MKKTTEELQKDFLKIQHQGKQSLRLFVLGMFLLLMGYCVLIGYMMRILYADFDEQSFTYLWRIGVQILWVIPFWQLWKYHKLGRFLYFLCFVYSIYSLKDIYYYVLDGQQTFTLNHYIMVSVACAWRIGLSMGLVKIFHNLKIRSIWSVYDMFDDELEEEIEFDKEMDKEEPFVNDSPVKKKAKKHLHKYSTLMGVFLYVFILLVLVMLLVLKTQSPSMRGSIEIIERTLFGNFLICAFLWMMPMVSMYMYHSSSRWLLLIALLGEVVNVIASFSSYLYIFTNSLVNISGKSIFIVVEVLRLTVLICLSIKVLRDPYCYHLWKKK